MLMISSEVTIILQKLRNNNKNLSVEKQQKQQNEQIQLLELQENNRTLQKLSNFYISLLPIHTLDDFYIIAESEIQKMINCEMLNSFIYEDNSRTLYSKNGCVSIGKKLIPELLFDGKYKLINNSDGCLEYINDLKIYFDIRYFRNMLLVPIMDMYNKIKIIILGVNKIDASFSNNDISLIGEIQDKLLSVLTRIQLSNQNVDRYLF